MPAKYVCEKCGNEVPAERYDKRVPGSKGMARAIFPVFCENDDVEMKREEFKRERRGESPRTREGWAT